MMRTAMLAAAMLSLTVGGSAWTQGSRSPASGGFYDLAQAGRGKALFATACASCHTADPTAPADADIPKRLPIALAGPRFLRKWATVGDLFSKVSTSMPIDRKIGAAGMKHDEYVDLVAYLLQVNGVPSGGALPGDTARMKQLPLNRANNAADRPPSAPSADGYYTAAQAERGRFYFYGSCNTCHIADSRTFTPDDLVAGRGFLNGRGVSLLSVVNPERFSERWRTVATLYNKIRTTMPGHDARGLSDAAYLDMTAYLLSVNQIPAGNQELTDDLIAMRGMTLTEPGFTKVFNGTDFSGLKFMIGANCKPMPAGCGQIGPGTTYKIDRRMVTTTGSPYGYMYTEKTYLNFTLRLEYRFSPVAGIESDDEFPGNSGYLLFITDHQVWPKYIEIQGANSGVLGVLSTGGKAVFTVDNEARKRAIKPVGQWNAIEIASANGQIRSSLNGVLISTITEHEYTGGHIGFQAEGSEISWRNIRIKEN